MNSLGTLNINSYNANDRQKRTRGKEGKLRKHFKSPGGWRIPRKVALNVKALWPQASHFTCGADTAHKNAGVKGAIERPRSKVHAQKGKHLAGVPAV